MPVEFDSKSFGKWVNAHQPQIDNTLKLPEVISLFSRDTLLTLEETNGIIRRNKSITNFKFLRSIMPITEIATELYGVSEHKNPTLEIYQLYAFINITIKAILEGKHTQFSYIATAPQSVVLTIDDERLESVKADMPLLQFSVISVTRESNVSSVILGSI